MRLSELERPVRYEITARGYHHGQHDLTLTAYDEQNDYLGHIDYSVYRDQPQVQMIEVAPEHRGQRYGPRLLRRLQAEFPETEIDLGGLTSAGAAMVAKMPIRSIPTPGYAEMAARLHVLQNKIAGWSRAAERVTANPMEKSRATLAALSDRWNRAESEVWRLEQELRYLKPDKRLFV